MRLLSFIFISIWFWKEKEKERKHFWFEKEDVGKKERCLSVVSGWAGRSNIFFYHHSSFSPPIRWWKGVGKFVGSFETVDLMLFPMVESGDGEERRVWKYLVLRAHDNTMFFVWSNGHN